MKKKIFDRRGAGIELAILMMVVSFSMSILLTSVALIQSTKKVRAEERLQQSIALEQLGQDFLSAVLKGDVDGWIQSINNKNNHTGHTEQATVHKWEEDTEKTSTDATCEADGVAYFVCSICKKTKEETIPKYEEHVLKESVINPTCTVPGSKTVTCEHCDYKEISEIEVLGHSCKSEETVIDGVLTQVCSICKMPYEDSDGGAHDWVEEAKGDPNCESEGTITYICNNCEGASKIETIPALGHSYDDGVITTPPTCTEKGEKTYTCATCGDSYTEEIPVSHTWGDNGKCTVCDETKPFEGKWDDAYELIVYKNGESFDVYVTITASNSEVCDPENANLEPAANDGDAEAAEPAGNQVLVIRVEKVENAENAENEFTYKITEWTKNDRS